MTTVAGLRSSAYACGPAAPWRPVTSVRVPVALLRPRLVRHLAEVGAELGDVDVAVLVRPGEVFVLELVVEADLAGRVEVAREVHPVDAGPVDGAHAHRARSAADEDLVTLEHLRPLRDAVGRAGRPGDVLQRGLVLVRYRDARRLGIKHGHGLADRFDLRVSRGVAGEQDAVLTAGDDLAVLGVHRAEGPAPVVVDRFLGEPTGLFHQLITRHGCRHHDPLPLEHHGLGPAGLWRGARH